MEISKILEQIKIDPFMYLDNYNRVGLYWKGDGREYVFPRFLMVLIISHLSLVLMKNFLFPQRVIRLGTYAE